MTGSRISAVVVSALVGFGLSVAAYAGGEPGGSEAGARLAPPVFDKLMPPPGPVEATMKTLDQVEPRVDANALGGDAQWEIIIDEPGSYYLSGSVNAQFGNGGISIRSAWATSDLGVLLTQFNTPGPNADINNDGVVDTADLDILLGAFGTTICP